MGQITLFKQIENDIAAQAVDGVMFRLFNSIDTLHQKPEINQQWVDEALHMYNFVQSVETGFAHGKAYMLAVIRDKWEDLPYEFRKAHNLSFIHFARLHTGKERSTIDNYINTANVWFIKKVRPDGPVTVTLRGPNGDPLKDGRGGRITQQMEFNPYAIEMTKLLIVNARATAGKMTPRLWEMLVDPFYSCDDLRREVAGNPENGDDLFYVPKYNFVGPGLYITKGDETACVTEELNWSEYDINPLVKEGINRIMEILGIDLDDDAIYDIIHRNYGRTNDL